MLKSFVRRSSRPSSPAQRNPAGLATCKRRFHGPVLLWVKQVAADLVGNAPAFAFGLTGEARPLKLRGSPKATPTTLISKEVNGTEGNDLKMVTAVLDDRK